MYNSTQGCSGLWNSLDHASDNNSVVVLAFPPHSSWPFPAPKKKVVPKVDWSENASLEKRPETTHCARELHRFLCVHWSDGLQGTTRRWATWPPRSTCGTWTWWTAWSPPSPWEARRQTRRRPRRRARRWALAQDGAAGVLAAPRLVATQVQQKKNQNNNIQYNRYLSFLKKKKIIYIFFCKWSDAIWIIMSSIIGYGFNPQCQNPACRHYWANQRLDACIRGHFIWIKVSPPMLNSISSVHSVFCGSFSIVSLLLFWWLVCLFVARLRRSRSMDTRMQCWTYPGTS